jgi:hypothetical protein
VADLHAGRPYGTVALVALARATAAALLLVFPCGGCLLFTDEINEAPQVTAILPEMIPLFRPAIPGPVAELTAIVKDDRDPPDTLIREWTLSPGDCRMAAAPGGVSRDHKYQLKLLPQRVQCVRVVAIDSRGARSQEYFRELNVANRDPMPSLERRAPTWQDNGKVKLHSRVELTAERSRDEDQDPLTFKFEATMPDGTKVEPGPCPSPSDERRCLSAASVGRYEATVTVSDGQRPVKAEPLVFEVDEDRPPCLELADPLPLQPLVLVPRGTRRTFEVRQVTDDGAPYPPEAGRDGETIFVWSKGAEGGGSLLRIAGNAPTLDVGEALFDNPRPGDQFRIRVEVRDRLVEERMQQRLLGPPCPEKQELCVVGTCRRWVTWKVQFFP